MLVKQKDHESFDMNKVTKGDPDYKSAGTNSMDRGQTFHPPEENCEETMRDANE